MLAGFKVVARKEKQLFSFISIFEDDLDSDGIVEYFLNKWCHPNFDCGPLAVFVDLKDAIKFINSNSGLYDIKDLEIYKCQYIPNRLTISGSLWIHFNSRMNCNIPLGTRLADKVMLVEKV